MSEAMTLDQWLTKIEVGHPTEIDLGLERVAEVASRLKIDLQDRVVITVAGTNGKGSTTCMLDSILREAGRSTGVYTSPHFLKYNERIRINSSDASDSDICSAFEAIDAVRDEISLTYFEYGTLAALFLFQQSGVEFIILEVGLGGRLDAVNIIDADVAVITSLALDHVDWLGNDLAGIAREKAGIFRAGSPAVCGVINPPSTVTAHAAELGTPLYLVGQDFESTVQGETWCWRGVNRHNEPLMYDQLPVPALPLPNATTVLQVISLLDLNITPEEIAKGLIKASMAGRMQRTNLGAAEMILDVAHNPEAAAYLAGRLSIEPVSGTTYLILGMLADKDRASVIQNLEPVVDQWLFCSLTGPRASQAAELSALASNKDSASEYTSVSAAIDVLKNRVRVGDRVLVCGSFLTVTEALVWLTQNP